MTFEELKSVKPGDILHSNVSLNKSDKLPMRVKVNGMVKLWKRSPDRIKVPVKHGMYDYAYITEHYFKYWENNQEQAIEIYNSRDNKETVRIVYQ
jgi:hypothetical protein